MHLTIALAGVHALSAVPLLEDLSVPNGRPKVDGDQVGASVAVAHLLHVKRSSSLVPVQNSGAVRSPHSRYEPRAGGAGEVCIAVQAGTESPILESRAQHQQDCHDADGDESPMARRARWASQGSRRACRDSPGDAPTDTDLSRSLPARDLAGCARRLRRKDSSASTR